MKYFDLSKCLDDPNYLEDHRRLHTPYDKGHYTVDQVMGITDLPKWALIEWEKNGVLIPLRTVMLGRRKYTGEMLNELLCKSVKPTRKPQTKMKLLWNRIKNTFKT